VLCGHACNWFYEAVYSEVDPLLNWCDVVLLKWSCRPKYNSRQLFCGRYAVK